MLNDENAELSGLPTLISNSLKNADITTLETLRACTKEKLRQLPNVGARSVNTVIDYLRDHGLVLVGEDGAEPLRVPQSVSIPFDILQKIDACRGDERRSTFVARTLREVLGLMAR